MLFLLPLDAVLPGLELIEPTLWFCEVWPGASRLLFGFIYWIASFILEMLIALPLWLPWLFPLILLFATILLGGFY
jgi:hypothetical protein